MKKVLAIAVLCLSALLAGCGTVRGFHALGGGITKDANQYFKHVLDHTKSNDAPMYDGLPGM